MTSYSPERLFLTDDLESFKVVSSASELSFSPGAPRLSTKIGAMMEKMSSEYYQSMMGSPWESGETYWDHLVTNFLQMTESPLSYALLLSSLEDSNLFFIIDDRLAIQSPSCQEVGSAVLEMRKKLQHLPSTNFMTKFQSIENRLHSYMDIIANVQTQDVYIRTLSNIEPLVLRRSAKSPEAFKQYAHENLRRFFRENEPHLQRTSIKRAFDSAFALTENGTKKVVINVIMGDLRQETRDKLAAYIKSRPYAKMSPIIFSSIYISSIEKQWFNVLKEDINANLMSYDDYDTEQQLVERNHGKTIEFTLGMYLVATLMGIRSYGLDALHFSTILSKDNLSDILGYTVTDEMYSYYLTYYPADLHEQEELSARSASSTSVARPHTQDPQVTKPVDFIGSEHTMFTSPPALIRPVAHKPMLPDAHKP